MTLTAAQTITQQVFDTLAESWAARAEDVGAFARTGIDFEPWCVWEGVAASALESWIATPSPSYAAVGVTGSREHADLLVSMPAQGRRVLVELAILHDLTANVGIGHIVAQAQRLARPMSADVVGLHVIVAVNPDGPVEVHPGWRQLDMMLGFGAPNHQRAAALPAGGELAILAWRSGDSAP
jgi:hypothetical protein